MKEDDEGLDIYEAFNRETGVFMVPEDGIYMIIVGDSNFKCSYDYVVFGERPLNYFYQGQSIANTQWMASGTKLQIYAKDKFTSMQFQNENCKNVKGIANS